MPYVDRPLPEGLKLPKLREPTPAEKKRNANLIHNGRIPGVVNKLSRDVKAGIINGAIAHGYDGAGEGGLDGFFRMCCERFPKNYMHLISKLVPLQVNSNVTGATINAVNIVSIPTGNYLSQEDIDRITGPRQIEHEQTPDLAPDPLET